MSGRSCSWTESPRRLPWFGPCGLTVKGSPLPAMFTPRLRRASSTADIGRALASTSPSKNTDPCARAAIGGTKRITVPARPHSTTPPRSMRGVTRSVWFGAPEYVESALMSVPRACSARIIRSVSRERRAPWITDGVEDSAAMTRARFVIDFEPAICTVALKGGRPDSAPSTLTVGADQF